MILVLDDHPVARQGLESIIRMCRPDEEILQAGSVREAISLAEKTELEMAFVDINLGKENGFDFLKWIREQAGRVKVFMITSSSSKKDFLRARGMEVDAYVLKDAFVDDIVYGLKVVERGEKFYSSALMENMGKVSEEEKLLSSLTRREQEVLYLLSQGDSNAKIAQKLFVSEGTVKKHISNLLGKLGMESRVEAILFANRNGQSLRWTNQMWGRDANETVNV